MTRRRARARPRDAVHLLMAGLTLLAGCAPHWVRVQDAGGLGNNPRQRVQLFSGARALDVHGFRVEPDSVSGVPYLKPLACDSCRVRVARSAVDSVRVVGDDDPTMLLLGAGIAVALVVMFSQCSPGGCVPGR